MMACNDYGMLHLETSREMPEPKCGRTLRTHVTAVEYCDRDADARHYLVTEWCGFYPVRQERIECESYLGTPDNFCGRIESAKAFALAREWAK